MADKCIENINKQQRFSEQNLNISESPESNDSSASTAILSAGKTRINLVTPTDGEGPNKKSVTEIIGNLMADNCLNENFINANIADEKLVTINNGTLFDRRKMNSSFLVTPVDDNNKDLGIESTATNSQQKLHCLRTSCMLDTDCNEMATKPKRLSDEFTTDEDRENEKNGNKSSAIIMRSGVELNYTSDSGSDVVDSSETRDIDDTKSIATIFGGAAVDDEISTCSLNLISENNPAPQHLEDSSSPHSSISTDMLSDTSMREHNSMNVSDVIEELTNQGDEHPQHRIAHDNHIFSNNSNLDVQSMDAIERSDFEIEQKATASRILGSSSLILRDNNDVRLNLGFINNRLAENQSDVNELIEPEAESENVSSKPGKSSTCTTSQASCSSRSTLVTTPTTSRNKRSRFNLSKSLEKCPEHPERSSDELVQYFNQQFDGNNLAALDGADVDAEANGSERDGQSDEEDAEADADAGIDVDADDEDDGVHFADADENSRPSTSRNESNRNDHCDCLYEPRRKCSCVCAHKSKKDVGTETDALTNGPQPSSSSHNENLPEDDPNNLMMRMEIENSYDDWSCGVNSEDEEVCTCREYSDDEAQQSSEDELPSRDVDLSYYSMSEDVLNGNSTETPTTRNHRKRKITETRSPLFCDMGSSCDTTNDRKRIALDNSKCSTPTTPSTTACTALNSPSSALRTPRSVIPTRDNPPPELANWLSQFQQWSHAERILALDRLIEHCEPTQVRYMMKVIEPQFQRDFISLLPKEVALQVLSFLPPKDLLRAAQTCRSWRYLCDDNLLWKEKCRRSEICIETTADRPRRGRVGNMPPISSPWKAAYMRQHIIEMNWRSRAIRDPKILKGHDDHVITCLQFHGNRIVSGSDDNTLKVWSAITGKCLRTLVGHTGGVWSSQMSANIIISGSTDRTLKVWNADNGNCIHTLMGHTSTVRCMHLHEKIVVSGSRDATLRVWDIVQGKCLHTLVGHLAAVRCVQYDGKLVVSGAYDYMVKVWNPDTEECLHTLQGHTNRVYSLQFDGVHVVSGSLDTSIRVWDAANGTCKHTLMGHQSLTSGMELRQNILVSGNADSTVKVWDITTGQCLLTLSGSNKHQSAVTCLQFNSRFVITSSDDGTVKLWDVKTGEFIRNLVALDSGGSGGVVWRIRSNDTKLICAVGSRNGTEETKLMVLDFDVEGACLKCS